MKVQTLLVSGALLLCFAHEALADKTYILATGRRDPRMYAIDLDRALRPANNNTPNAIVSRSKVALRGRSSGTSTAAISARSASCLLKDLFIVGNAESHLTEDGGNRITFIDRRTGSLRGAVELALGNGGNDPYGLAIATKGGHP